MKYLYEQYDFKWIEYSNTSDEVREHEKIHLKNNKLKTFGMGI